jgi:predicted RNA-binding Zn ribbon-like protein
MGIAQLELIGGFACLDFVNTAGDHLSDQPGEWLLSYRDLLTWARRAGILADSEALQLEQQAGERPEAAGEALARAIAMREAIYHLFLSVIRQQAPDSSDLAAFNRALAGAPPRSGVIYRQGAYQWQFSTRGTVNLDGVLWRLLWGAADLLTSDRLAQVKLCAGEDCGWLFLDASRNQSRRWCSMSDCGNRAKAKRYYRRHKDAV